MTEAESPPDFAACVKNMWLQSRQLKSHLEQRRETLQPECNQDMSTMLLETYVANLESYGLILQEFKLHAPRNGQDAGTMLQLENVYDTTRAMLHSAHALLGDLQRPRPLSEDTPMADRSPQSGAPAYQSPFVEDDDGGEERRQDNTPQHVPANAERPWAAQQTPLPKRLRQNDDDDNDETIAAQHNPKRRRSTPEATAVPKRKHVDNSSPSDVPAQSTKKTKRRGSSADGDLEPEFVPVIEHEDISAEVDARIRAKDQMRARERARLQDMNSKRKNEPRDVTWIMDGREEWDDPNTDRRKRSRVV